MTVEALVPCTGRSLQGDTSHHLGQNFSKMFNIQFQHPKDPTGAAIEYAYQNSWGITQRTIGVMVMVHGDDKGLVLPPNVACYQVVIVPVGMKATTSAEDRKKLEDATMDYFTLLKEAGIRVKLDDSDNSPGWKFNNWEMKGIPLRIELGPMDLEKGEFVMSKRHILDKSGKVTGKRDCLVETVQRTLKEIHSELYDRALSQRDESMVHVNEWKDFSPNLNKGRMCLVPFCGAKACEEWIKEKSKEEAADAEVQGGLKMGAKSLCIPHEDKFHQNCPPKCICYGNCEDCKCTNVTKKTLFGRSY